MPRLACLLICLLLGCSTTDPPLVLGHRGFAWDHRANPYPENSAAAVRAALAAGADGAEVDVYLSRDGVPVLAHEDPLDARHRHRNRSTCTAWITASEWGDIAGCRLRPGKVDAPDGALSRLEEVIDLPGLRLLVVDVKNDFAGHDLPATIAALARIVHGYDAGERVVLMVYTHSGLGLARQHGLRACLKRHLLRGFSEAEAADEIRRAGAWGQCANSRIVTAPLMRALAAVDTRQVPYLLGHRIRAGELALIWSRFRAWGVHAIITDRVPEAVRIRDAQR